MAELLNQIITLLEGLVLSIGYPGLILATAGEVLIPPIPTDPGMLPLGGLLAAQGHLSVIGVWLAAVFGFNLGAWLAYLAGRKLDEHVLRALIRRWGRFIHLDEVKLEAFMRLFRRFGIGLVFFGRVLAPARGPISLVAGMSRMHPLAFGAATLLSSSLTSAFYIGLGYFLGERWREILRFVDAAEPLLWAGLALLLIAALLLWLRRRRKKRASPLFVQNV